MTSRRSLAALALVLPLLASCESLSPTAPAARRVLGSGSPQPGVLAPVAVTFRVTVPAATPAGSTVHVAGDFQGWNPASPAHALTVQPDGKWQLHAQ